MLRTSRVVLVSLAALSGAACGRRKPLQVADAGNDTAPVPPVDACVDATRAVARAEAAIPLGVYTACASKVVEGGGTVEGAGGTISVASNGGALTIEIGKGVLGFVPGTLAFTPLTASAAVAAPGQTLQLTNVPCATSVVSSGALTLEGDALVVSLVGAACPNAVGATLRCTAPAVSTGALAAPDACADGGTSPCGCAPPPRFPVGTYVQCAETVSFSRGGTVTVAESGDVVTAAVDAMTGVAPAPATLLFTQTAAKTATISPGQTWVVSVSGATQPFVDDNISIASGALVVDGSTLFVFVRGMDADGDDVVKSFHCRAGD
jgi:hypothetical protein